jgi:hypothetical protein
MKQSELGNILAEVVNNNPGLNKKAVYVPHEGLVYHGRRWTTNDVLIHKANLLFNKTNRKVKECDLTVDYAYCLHLPPTADTWMSEQAWFNGGDPKEIKKHIDYLVETEPVFAAAKREM